MYWNVGKMSNFSMELSKFLYIGLRGQIRQHFGLGAVGRKMIEGRLRAAAEGLKIKIAIFVNFCIFLYILETFSVHFVFVPGSAEAKF